MNAWSVEAKKIRNDFINVQVNIVMCYYFISEDARLHMACVSVVFPKSLTIYYSETVPLFEQNVIIIKSL